MKATTYLVPSQELERAALNGGDERIYGGVEAMPNEFPWMVYVNAFPVGSGNGTQSTGYQQGGALISSQYVLSDASLLGYN